MHAFVPGTMIWARKIMTESGRSGRQLPGSECQPAETLGRVPNSPNLQFTLPETEAANSVSFTGPRPGCCHGLGPVPGQFLSGNVGQDSCEYG